MRALLMCVRRFVRSEEGPTAVEYAVMLALVILVCITAITSLGSNTSDLMGKTAQQGGFGGS